MSCPYIYIYIVRITLQFNLVDTIRSSLKIPLLVFTQNTESRIAIHIATNKNENCSNIDTN